jgi:Chaperone of endosialidase
MAPFDGAANFQLPAGSDVATGDDILASDLNIPLTDIEAALNECFLRDGTAGMTGDLNLNGNDIIGITVNAIIVGDAGAEQTITSSSAGSVLKLESTNAGAATGPTFTLYRNSATPAASDVIGSVSFAGKDSAGNSHGYGFITATISDPTNGSEDGSLAFGVSTAGTLANELILTGASLRPNTNDRLALGASTLAWSDLFLATGSVVDFGAGNVTVTHSSGFLLMDGGQWRVSKPHSTTIANLYLRISSGSAASSLFQQFIASNGSGVGSITADAVLGTSGVSYNTTSDLRLKSDIRAIDDSGDIVDALRPIWFTMGGAETFGFGAQDIAAIPALKHTIIEGHGEPGDEDFMPWQMQHGRLEAILVAEIQALRARVAALEAKIGA